MVDLFGFLMLVYYWGTDGSCKYDFARMIEDDYAILLLKVAPSCQKLIV